METNSSGLDLYSRSADEQRAKNSQNQIGLTVGGSILILMGGAGLVLLVRQRR